MRLSPILLPAVLLLGGVSLAPASEGPLDASAEDNPYGRLYPPRVYDTVRLAGEAPSIDGRLDDVAWQEGQWSGDYTQYMPTEGAEPSQPTEIKILYDDKNVYVAIRAYDDPQEVHRHTTRRDTFAGDIVGVCFDSYFDKRTGFEFDLNAGGSKIDLILGNDGWDTTWDAVWDGKVGMEDDAWTAEFQDTPQPAPLRLSRGSGLGAPRLALDRPQPGRGPVEPDPAEQHRPHAQHRGAPRDPRTSRRTGGSSSSRTSSASSTRRSSPRTTSVSGRWRTAPPASTPRWGSARTSRWMPR